MPYELQRQIDKWPNVDIKRSIVWTESWVIAWRAAYRFGHWNYTSCWLCVHTMYITSFAAPYPNRIN